MRHFHESEFSCPCGCGLDFNDINLDAIKALIIARAFAKTPFIITSSIRCKKRNSDIGGSPTSSHLNGTAFDIHCDNSADRMGMIQSLIAAGFTRIGIDRKFIHADLDKTKTQNIIWVY